MWEELGVSGGTAIIVLITLYFVIKWAVKNGIKEAYRDITGKKTDEDRYFNCWNGMFRLVLCTQSAAG